MNLVIDDAVEVKLATKDEEESRKRLGQFLLFTSSRSIRLRNVRDSGHVPFHSSISLLPVIDKIIDFPQARFS